MRTIGIDLEPWLKKGLLHIEASRPSLHGLEMHLVRAHKLVAKVRPDVVIMDPISNLTSAGTQVEAEAMLVRLIDFLKTRGVTAMFTNLTSGGNAWERTDIGVSSLIDTWILLRDIELGGERNRGLYVLKSRGMKHSNQIREFLITPHGIELQPVYVGAEGVLTGSMRAAQEAREQAAQLERAQQAQRRQHDLAARRAALEAQIRALQAESTALDQEASLSAEQHAAREATIEGERTAAAARRGSAPSVGTAGKTTTKRKAK
jgi:circadian clock protein KaiC